MRGKMFFLKAAAAAFVISGILPVCVSASESNEKKEWAIYLYVCGNDLESVDGFASANLQAILDADRTEDTVIVAQTGGASEWKNSEIQADKMQRWFFTEDEMKLVDEQDQVNMGESDTLADFLTFATENYPADHTMVILWDHGNGTLDGCCADENYGDDWLSLTEMHDAFSKVYDLSETTPPVDILGFDACLMASIDVADTFTDTAQYLVASEETEPGDGWNYKKIVDSLGENPDLSAKDLGILICDSYYEKIQQNDEANDTNQAGKVTLSLTDLSQVGTLSQAFNQFADELLIDAYFVPENFKTYSSFARLSENYGGNSRAEGYSDYTDIKDFVQNIGSLMDSTDDVLQALEECIVYKVNGENRPEGGGLSFYFDYDGWDEKNDKYVQYGKIDGLKVLYTLGVTQELDEFGREYVEGLGLDPDTLPEIITLEKCDCNEKPVQFDENENAYVDFGSDVSSCIIDAMTNVYYMKDGELYYIGSNDEISSDFTTGIITSQMSGNWGYLEGNLACMELIFSCDSYALYSIPIKVYGMELGLQLEYDTASQTWSVFGVRQPKGATVLSGRYIELPEDTEVTLITQKIGDDGEIVREDGATFTYHGDSSFEYKPLEDGYYAVRYVIEDYYTNQADSDSVSFEMKDGVMTFDRE